MEDDHAIPRIAWGLIVGAALVIYSGVFIFAVWIFLLATSAEHEGKHRAQWTQG